MDNDYPSFDFGYCKLKTARQKKRLQQKDSDKQLRALYMILDKLELEKRQLPLVLLDVPYQKGWVRTFRLRDDIARNSKASFFQTLLEKINTKSYNNEKSFIRKKGKRKKKLVPPEQGLKTFSREEWSSPKLKLTEAEKQFFFPKEHFDPFNKCVTMRYTFVEPWRYVFQIKPNMITHIKLLDEVLEQQINQIENHIERNNLWPGIRREVFGKNYHVRHYKEKAKYTSPIKNKSFHCILQEANNDII